MPGCWRRWACAAWAVRARARPRRRDRGRRRNRRRGHRRGRVDVLPDWGGPHRRPEPGFHLDLFVLVVGAVGVAALVVVLAAWPASRAAGTAVESEAVPDRLSFWGRADALAKAPLPVGVGVRMALEPGRGRSALAVRSSLAAVTLGVTTLVAAITFGAGLSHLLTTPALYGQSLGRHADHLRRHRADPRGPGPCRRPARRRSCGRKAASGLRARRPPRRRSRRRHRRWSARAHHPGRTTPTQQERSRSNRSPRVGVTRRRRGALGTVRVPPEPGADAHRQFARCSRSSACSAGSATARS